MINASGETSSAVVEAAGLPVKNGSMMTVFPPVSIEKVPCPSQVIVVLIVKLVNAEL